MKAFCPGDEGSIRRGLPAETCTQGNRVGLHLCWATCSTRFSSIAVSLATVCRGIGLSWVYDAWSFSCTPHSAKIESLLSLRNFTNPGIISGRG